MPLDIDQLVRGIRWRYGWSLKRGWRRSGQGGTYIVGLRWNHRVKVWSVDNWGRAGWGEWQAVGPARGVLSRWVVVGLFQDVWVICGTNLREL